MGFKLYSAVGANFALPRLSYVRVIARNTDEAAYYLNLRGMCEKVSPSVEPKKISKDPRLLHHKVQNQMNLRRHGKLWPGTVQDVCAISCFALKMGLSTVEKLWTPNIGILSRCIYGDDSFDHGLLGEIQLLEEQIPGWTIKYAREHEYVQAKG